MDPFFANQASGRSIMRTLFDNLLEIGFDDRIVPGLATSWKAVDEKTLELRLRTGVKFHNGEAFDAEAVKFSIERILKPELKAPFRSLYTSIDAVTVVDSATVRVALKKPDATIVQALALLQVVPPKHLAQVGDQTFGKTPIGTGPFKFVEWVKDDHATVEVNRDYFADGFKGKPMLERVTFRPIPEESTRVAELKAGRVHIVQDLSTDRIRDLETAGMKVVSNEGGRYFSIWLGAKTGPLADRRVRQALNHAVNVDAIIANLLSGQGKRMASPFVKGALGYDASIPPYAYDAGKAKSLLAEAGHPNGFSATLEACTCDRLDLTQAVVADLAKIGVNLTIRTNELAIFNDNWIKGKIGEMIALRLGDPGDQTKVLTFLVKSDGLVSRFSDPAADKLIAESLVTFDQEKRAATYGQLARLLRDNPPAIYLWSSTYLYGLAKGVEGWKAHSTGDLVIGGTALR